MAKKAAKKVSREKEVDDTKKGKLPSITNGMKGKKGKKGE